MTGYGKGTADNGKTVIDVEVRTVNSRYLDISLKIPSSLLGKESELRELVRNKIKRGKLSILIQSKRNGGNEGALLIDKDKVKSYSALIKEIRKTAKLTDKIKLEHFLNNKDYFIATNGEYSEEDYELIKKALGNALNNLIKMKKNEGKELAADLRNRVKMMEEKLADIESERESSVKEYFEKLKDRVKLLINDNNLDEGRLEQELAVIAEKADITEECVRLRSHIKFFNDTVERDSEPGRKLNFLCQEMNRETNTISSKSISTSITHNTVLIKEEIEKLREQIQNIE